MRNDQIFVLMLVVLLPLTGCFDGGGIGDADAQNSTNYDDIQVLYVPTNTVDTITTRAGEFVEILDAWADYNGEDSDDRVTDYRERIIAEFNCSSHESMKLIEGIGSYQLINEHGNDWLPTDGSECTYYFDRRGTNPDDGTSYRQGDLYVIYRIH